MLPIILEISGQKISLFGILIAMSLIVYLFSGWVYLRKELDIKKIFDILFLSVINYIIFSRFFGFLENTNYYINDLSRIIDFRDNNFSFIGLFIGFIISVILINKLLIIHHQNKRKILEHIFLIFMISVIPLLVGNLLTGRMLGVEVSSSIGVLYDDGTRRMPISLIRIFFFILSVFAFQIIRRDMTRRLTNIIAGFFMGFAAFEIVIITFSKDYTPTILGIINAEQLFAFFVFVLGTIILFGKRFSKIAYDEQAGKGRRTREELLSNISAVDYSYSYKDINFSINQSELSIKEKFRILINSIKRRFKR